MAIKCQGRTNKLPAECVGKEKELAVEREQVWTHVNVLAADFRAEQKGNSHGGSPKQEHEEFCREYVARAMWCLTEDRDMKDMRPNKYIQIGALRSNRPFGALYTLDMVY